MDVLTVDHDHATRVATLTLDRPHSGNALNDPLHSALDAAWKKVAADADIDGVVLTGAGTRWFCTGRDVKELAATQRSGEELARDRGGVDAASHKGFIPAAYPKPVLLALNGSVVGGGWSFVSDADLVFAAPQVRLLDRHAQAGQFGGFDRIYRSLPRKIAVELMLTDLELTAQRALDFGLINRIVEQDELLAQSQEAMSRIVSLPPAALAAYVEALRLMRQHEENPFMRGFLRLQARQTRQSAASQEVLQNRFGTGRPQGTPSTSPG